jgi:hypothetical protein
MMNADSKDPVLTGEPIPSGAKSEVTGGFPEDINGMPSTGNFVDEDGTPKKRCPDGSGLSPEGEPAKNAHPA